MGWLDSILAGGVKGLAEGVGSLAKDIRTAITGEAPLTSEQRAQIQERLDVMEAVAQKAAAEYDTVQMAGQLEINKIEAASPSFYKSGWRPAVGWVCVVGLGYDFVVRPLFPWIWNAAAGTALPPMPPLDMATLGMLLSGILGLGTMRTLERFRGRA